MVSQLANVLSGFLLLRYLSQIIHRPCQGTYPVKDTQHCGDPQPMCMERVNNISAEQPGDGMPQPAAGAPGKAHGLKRAQAKMRMVCRVGERQANHCSYPEYKFEVSVEKLFNQLCCSWL